MPRALSLRWPQWFVMAALLLGLGAVGAIVVWPQLRDWYLEAVQGPRFQQEFGFKTDYVTLVFRGEPYQQFTIAEVVPNGAFERAGVLPGDVPFGYVHGVAPGFFADLLSARSTGSVK